MVDLTQAKQQLIKQIQQYNPLDSTEQLEKDRILNFLKYSSNVYSRENLTGHVTVSSWVINKDKSKVLLIHHNIFDCWAPMGGHSDNDPNLAQVALRESIEESGNSNMQLVSNNIIDIAIMPVIEHEKRGKTVPQHFHFDLRYLVQADENDELNHEENEVSNIKWFNLNEVESLDIDIMKVIKRVLKKVHNK